MDLLPYDEAGPLQWVSGKVVEAGEHVVKCIQTHRGPPVLVAYEDVRVRPKGELTRQLMSQNVWEEFEVNEATECHQATTILATDIFW